jgi:hypothetical protein
MNFKKFNDIGDSEPRAWKRGVGSRFETDDEEDDEIPVPYCDDFEDEEEEPEAVEDEVETETDTESISSVITSKKMKFFSSNILHEEFDFKHDV